METTLAERIADTFTAHLDMTHLSKLDCWILHAIKAVAVRQWARQALIQERGF